MICMIPLSCLICKHACRCNKETNMMGFIVCLHCIYHATWSTLCSIHSVTHHIHHLPPISARIEVFDPAFQQVSGTSVPFVCSWGAHARRQIICTTRHNLFPKKKSGVAVSLSTEREKIIASINLFTVSLPPLIHFACDEKIQTRSKAEVKT